MDVCKLLKNVNNINNYISTTQDIINNFSNSKIQFNVSTVIALNKIRSLEIEYFNKCGENGAAIKMLDLILRMPPSKSWSLLGKEIISLIQYWLDALRKHLIAHNNHWWNFLSILLEFIKEIHLKSLSLNDTIVLQTAECLLDIATTDQPDLTQRYKTIQCLNYICAESKREIRFSLRNKLDNYFIKLSTIMASCGDLRTQISIMETLLRWLLPRQDLAVRREASIKWFPSSLCSSQAVEIFLQRSWQNFFKDARDFLNAFNEANNLVTSVLCRRLTIGSLVLISGSNKNDHWLDLNAGGKCISVILDSRLLEILESSQFLGDALVLSEDNTNNIQMSSQSSEILISLTVMDTLRVYRSNVLDGCDVTIAISTRSDLSKVDRALRSIFDTKYQLLIDIEDSIELSPRDKSTSIRTDKNMMVDDPRFSHPLEKNRKHSGYITRPRNPSSIQSPSTASTSSLAMLREKLTAFPGYKYDKKQVAVCASPKLSSVTELSETDKQQNLNASLSTLKLRSYGVCHKKRNNEDKNAVSESDSSKERSYRSRSDDISVNETNNATKCISPINNNDDSSVISCLLVATIGSVNESVINDTLERLPKDKEIHTDNIIDLLAQEAMMSKRQVENDNIQNITATGDKEIQGQDIDVIENTRCIDNAINVKKTPVSQKRIQVNNSTTTDESNTDVVEQTPNIDNVKITDAPKNKEPNQTFDVRAMEDLFSQHLIENRHGYLDISPTIAKKINETSSESSGSFDFRPNVQVDFNEIVECLNEIVDRVCKDFEKCNEYFNNCMIINDNKNDDSDVQNKITSQKINKETTKCKPKPVKNIKLKYTNTKKQTKTQGKKKFNMDTVKKMSPIIEGDSVIEDTAAKKTPEMHSKRSDEDETPLIKRKRKLYSPKDDHLVNERAGVHVSETDEDNTILSNLKTYERTPKSMATSYKDIENLRKSIRKKRNRTSKSAPSLSPRSKKKNDVFDNLKKTCDGEEKVTLVKRKTRNKKFAVYNFSSDSDEEIFQIKKLTKESRTTPKSSVKATVRRKRSNPKVNYSELNNESTDDQSNKNIKRTPVRQKANKDRQRRTIKRKNELVDEKMRAPVEEILNTSIVIDPPTEELVDPDPTHIKPQMENINNEQENEAITKKKLSKRNKDLSLKKGKNKKTESVITSDREKTDSPLPGLLVETEQEIIDADESIKMLMTEKFNETCNEGPNPDLCELNITQNSLLDIDANNNSPPKLNITDELNNAIKNQDIQRRFLRRSKNEVLSDKNNKDKMERRSSISIINISEELGCRDGISEKTITTGGKSPITAHGYINESPPCTKQLKQTFRDRSLETQNLDKSMKDYFHKLTNEINEASNKSSSSNDSNKLIISKKNIIEKSPTVSITRLSVNEINRWLPPRYNPVFGSNQSSVSNESSKKFTRNTRSNTKKTSPNDNALKLKNKSKESDTQMNYKSVISPVKSYGGFSGKEKSVTSHEDDYIERIKSLMTSKKQISKCETVSKSSRYDLRKFGKKQEASCSRFTEISKSTDGKDLGKAGKRKSSSPEIARKRKSSSPEIARKRKIDDLISVESVTVAESAASGSSVHDWLNTIEREKHHAESLDLSMKDSLENIIENLDTTLVEIHHSTSKKFVKMFVDTQKQLNHLKEQRIQIFEDSARSMMTEFVKIMVSKFTSFERRCEELEEKFMTDIKEKARNLVHEDCKQKRVMLTLLKEDIQAYMEHIKRRRHT